MGHQRGIEAIRETRPDLPSSGRRPRRRRRHLWRRRLIAFFLLLVAAAVVVAVVAWLTGGGSGGGDFAGTWQKRGSSGRVVIEQVEGDTYQVSVPGGKTKNRATLKGGVLTAESVLGIKDLTLTFTLEEDGSVLVETFPNGSQDKLDRAR